MHWADYVIFGLTSAVAVLYIFLMIDTWHIGRVGRAVYVCGTGTLSVLLGHLLPVPAELRLFVIWLVMLLPLVWLSRVRDARLVFVMLTGMMISYMSVVLSALFALHFGVHRLPVRLVLDIIGLVLCYRFIPMFHRVFQVMRQGWLICSLLPLSVVSAYFVFWDYWYYPEMLAQPNVQTFAIMLIIITPLTYVVLFHFIGEQRQQHNEMLVRQLLQSQCAALQWQAERHERQTLQSKILRHDLRHYMPLLSACIDAGAEADARALLAQMRQLLQESDAANKAQGTIGAFTLDVALDYYIREAERLGVPLTISLQQLHKLSFPPIVLTAFVSYAIDGALLSCTLSDAPPHCRIKVFSQMRKGEPELCVANPYTGKIVYDAATGFPMMKSVASALPNDASILLLQHNGAAVQLVAHKGWFIVRLTHAEGGTP